MTKTVSNDIKSFQKLKKSMEKVIKHHCKFCFKVVKMYKIAQKLLKKLPSWSI